MLKILIIDDIDAENIGWIIKNKKVELINSLSEIGLQSPTLIIDTATTTEIAIKKIQSELWDVILLDMNLPINDRATPQIENSDSLFKEIKQSNQLGYFTYVVYMSTDTKGSLYSRYNLAERFVCNQFIDKQKLLPEATKSLDSQDVRSFISIINTGLTMATLNNTKGISTIIPHQLLHELKFCSKDIYADLVNIIQKYNAHEYESVFELSHKLVVSMKNTIESGVNATEDNDYYDLRGRKTKYIDFSKCYQDHFSTLKICFSEVSDWAADKIRILRNNKCHDTDENLTRPDKNNPSKAIITGKNIFWQNKSQYNNVVAAIPLQLLSPILTEFVQYQQKPGDVSKLIEKFNSR